MGRLFDGVAAILRIRDRAAYEGQAATLLEAEADENERSVYPYEITEKDGMYVFDWREMIRAIVRDKNDGRDTGKICAAFMNTLVAFSVEMTAKIAADTGLRTVAMSGGTLQNMYLLERLHPALRSAGFNVLVHHRVAANDEGISLGQALVAAHSR